MPTRNEYIYWYPASAVNGGSPVYRYRITDSWSNGNRQKPNPCAINRFNVKGTLKPGDNGKVSQPYVVSTTAQVIAVGINPTRVYESAYNSAYMRYRSNLLNGTGAELGVTIAQWRQALEMLSLKSRALALLTSRQVRRGAQLRREYQRVKNRQRKLRFLKERNTKKRLKGPKRTPTPLANGYLETVFGWTPLLGDIRAALDTITNLQGYGLATGRGRSFDQKAVTDSGNQRGTRKVRYQVNVTLQARYVVTNANLYLASAMGLTNPLAVVWDIIPWSFMLSYVSNIGSVVRALTPTLGLSIVDGSVTRTSRAYVESSYVTVAGSYKGSAADTSAYWFTKLRTVTTSFASPTLMLKPPSGWRAVADNTALYLQNMDKIRKLTS